MAPVAALGAPRSSAQAAAAGSPTATRPVVREATRNDTSTTPVRAYPPKPSALGEVFPTKPAKLLPNRTGSAGPAGPDPVLQESAPEATVPTLEGSFEGINNVDGVLPPDPVGDIGPNHYVQMVNLSFAVFSRSGTKLAGPVDINTLFAGFGGPCETTNDGDPIVLYDERADRWLLSQFALPRFPRGPFYQCIAISKTGDPTGAYHRYEFLISDAKLNDYPKFGVWNDTYFMSVNQFSCNVIRCSWGGQGVVAFERNQMLVGGAARMVYFDLYNLDPNLGGMLPADFDGPSPPAGSPGIFSQVDDNAWGYSPDQLQIWEFAVNWASPSGSTFTRVATPGVAGFDSNMCGYSRNCIPQPGGTRLDALSDRLMNRLQYRNFGSHETLVVNHTVDSNGSDRAGVRWYELRNTGSGWAIHQQATFSPDSTHRWMASAAMNGSGDIGLGYSASSTSLSPSIRATGRLDGDPLGQMTQAELTIVNGSGYQEHSSGRWGDYSSMNVDPLDDCTFWYTAEYYASAGSAPWRTRIGSFKLRDCGGGGGDDTTPPNAPSGLLATGGDARVDLTWDANTDSDLATYSVYRRTSSDSGYPTTPLASVAPSSSPAYADTAVTNGTTYCYVISAVDTNGNESASSNEACATPTAPSGATTLHVGDLDGSSTSQGSTWTALVTITVHDANHGAVAGATVTGSWSAGATGVASCTTDASGQCVVSVSGIRKRNSSVTFTVTTVTHSTLTYEDASGNHDPDGDSSGTTITLAKP